MSTSVANHAATVNAAVRPLRSTTPIKRYSSQLAAEIGERESLVLLQLDYLLSVRGLLRMGSRRIRVTLDDVGQWFPTWSRPTIRRVLHRMIAGGLLDAKQAASVDRGRWFGFGPAVVGLTTFRPTAPRDLSEHPARQLSAVRPDSPASPRSAGADQQDHVARESSLESQENLTKIQDQGACAREKSSDQVCDLTNDWARAKARMTAQFSAANFRTYIEPLRLSSIRDGHGVLIAPSQFVADGARRYLSTIRAAMSDQLGAKVQRLTVQGAGVDPLESWRPSPPNLPTSDDA